VVFGDGSVSETTETTFEVAGGRGACCVPSGDFFLVPSRKNGVVGFFGCSTTSVVSGAGFVSETTETTFEVAGGRGACCVPSGDFLVPSRKKGVVGFFGCAITSVVFGDGSVSETTETTFEVAGGRGACCVPSGDFFLVPSRKNGVVGFFGCSTTSVVSGAGFVSETTETTFEVAGGRGAFCASFGVFLVPLPLKKDVVGFLGCSVTSVVSGDDSVSESTENPCTCSGETGWVPSDVISVPSV